MSLAFKDKVVLVTGELSRFPAPEVGSADQLIIGGTKGIGRRIVEALYEE